MTGRIKLSVLLFGSAALIVAAIAAGQIDRASADPAGPPGGLDVTVINTPLPVTGTVNVGNTPLDVNVNSLPGTPLELDFNYHPVSLDCRNDPPNSVCSDSDNPDDTAPKLIHTATVGVVVEDGAGGCRAVAQIQDSGNGSVFRTLLEAYATPESPGVLSLTFAKPILIGAEDGVTLQMTALLNDPDPNSHCRANATFGVELMAP